MSDLDDELLALAGDSQPKDKKRKRTRPTYQSDSEESGVLSDEGSDDEDETFADVKSWGADLMGDAADRTSLKNMTELERETILADRRKRLELLQEHREVKARLGQNLGRRSERKAKESIKKDKKGRELERLKKKRLSKAQKKGVDSESDSESDDFAQESDYEQEDDYYQGDVKETKIKEKAREAALEDIQKIQLKRTDLEKWVNTPFFDKTVKGCFVRLAVGMDPASKEQVYRVTLVTKTGLYHRPYRFGKYLLKTTLELAHGKSAKEFLMDLVSNSPITEKEWNRYLKIMKYDGQSLITTDHVNRKVLDLQKAQEHVYTEQEITEMIKLKRANDKLPVNVAARKLEIQQQMTLAKESGDQDALLKLKNDLHDLDQKVKDATTKDIKLEQFSSLNAKNRDINYKEGRQAEKAATLAKKQKSATDSYDPFARRKTAPKHVIHHNMDEEKEVEKPKPNSKSSSPGKTQLKADRSPYLLASKVIIDDDDFLDSVDLSQLEAEL